MSAPAGGSARDLPIAECSLDLEGSRAQRERYREIGRHLVEARREPGRLRVRLAEGVDEHLVARTLAVERECCEFFGLEYDRRARELSVTVAEAAQDPALDAIAEALGAPVV